MRALFGARSNRDSISRCASYFRRDVAWAALNVNAKLKLERAEFVGWCARTASVRRAEEARRAAAQRAACAQARAAFEHPGAGEGRRFPWDRRAAD